MNTFMRTLMLAALAVLLAAAPARATNQPHAWQIVIPSGVVETQPVDPAPRLTSLEGKTVVLRWNSMENGNVFLNRLAELMAKRLPWTKVVKSYELDDTLNAISGSNVRSRSVARSILDLHPDLVIAAQCDSGTGTPWLVIDQSYLEKAGVPTITIATTDFLDLARGIQKGHGLNDMCFVTLPRRINNLSRQEVIAQTDASFDDIIQAAAKWTPTKPEVTERTATHRARHFVFTGTSAELNALFDKRHWSLSHPFVPPTMDRVAAMLKGTQRDPDEVVWVVPPRQGMLTVELVAALGVMAGARPEHMPLLLATVEAMKTSGAARRDAAASSAEGVAIVKKLGLATGATGGNGSLASAIKYFISLVGNVVGGSVSSGGDETAHGAL